MRTSRLTTRARRAAVCVALVSLFGTLPAHADGGPVVSVQTVQVHRDTIAQPVRAYGIVAASASSVTTLNLPYVARITQMRVQAGQRVTRGMPLVVVEADPAAVLAATQARSALTLAQGEVARTQSLFDKGLATQSQLASAKKAAQDAQQALAEQNQMGVGPGARTVTAPLDGVVLQVSVAQGDQVQPGAAIMQLAAGDSGKDARANVTLGVEPSDAASIHAGDAVTLHGLSVALAKSALPGRVVMVGASVDPQSQLVNIGANVPLGQTAFIPGTRVSADIATNTGTHWIVPRNAVLKDDHGDYVFQITSAKTAHRVNVVKRVEDGGRYGVDGAIDGALPLVVSGNYELTDGMAVQTGSKAGGKADGSAAR
ncbi:efflux RND transporter periplasmic adaptor subunit [Paraburkholderia sp.]|uniref:efflux RND transporter periplasmic adaptor subunit n=1 Tax=Paraburkholderia sp. TaxID=1926495 RepID=UPI00257A9EE0|nr:efflux RND transporter periplasmic adaptor subunit [Paraburkholderia sp.]